MSQAQQAEKRVGTVIGGKWRVDALLGSGSMAAVYGVTHRNGARAALKILHPTLCTDPSVCERFLGEGYLANSVKHQGIVRVLDDGIVAAHWLSREQLLAQSPQLRSPLVLRCIDDHLAGHRHDLQALVHMGSAALARSA